MKNIYNAIQNVYNMDKTTWQEVLAELYNLVSNVENKEVTILGKVQDLENRLNLLEKNYVMIGENININDKDVNLFNIRLNGGV